jgi:hypothetical protein
MRTRHLCFGQTSGFLAAQGVDSVEAAPSNEPNEPAPGVAHRRRRRHRHEANVVVVPAPVYVAPAGGIYVATPPPPPPPPPPPHVEQPEPPRPERPRVNVPRFQLMGFMQPVHPDGLASSLHLTIGGARGGVDAHFDHFGPRPSGAGDWSGRSNVSLLNLSWGYAVLLNQNFRLRVHLGAHAVLSPKMAALGPGLGASMDLHVLGPLYVDAASHLVVYPFSELNAQAGATLKLGPVGLKAGLRGTVLDARIAEISPAELVFGPYLGVGLMF